MVHRDPETGKFVSDADDRGVVSLDELDVFTGSLRVRIPAADLTSGIDNFELDGEDAEIVDWTQYLNSDEVFQVHGFRLVSQIIPGRTATAENQSYMSYALRSQSAIAPDNDAGFDTAVENSGPFEIISEDSDDDDIMLYSFLGGFGSFSDSASGVSAGGSEPVNDHATNYTELELPGPAFDQDDELYVPSQITVDGSDDQAWSMHHALTVYGQTYEV